MSIARRSVSSVAWTSISHWVCSVILFLRSVLLARWLPVETFGVYALATSVLQISITFTSFGMSSAFLHRSPETEEESQAAAVHFTLSLIFTSAWAILFSVGALVFADGQMQVTFLVLIATTTAVQLTQTPRLILARRVVYRRLALLSLIDTVISTLIALWLASRGVALGALLSVNVSKAILTLVLIYFWRPVWRPRILWLPAVMRYYLGFGSLAFLASLLNQALDRVDDLWTGFSLGDTALGFYSRAYAFSTYPRKILAQPVNSVVSSTYAELKQRRYQLSRAFTLTNALLFRSGSLVCGLLALIAPEFIRLVLGSRWLPMLEAFRLMLVFTMLDPIRSTTGNLFTAIGKPGDLVRIGTVQLVTLAAGLFLLGPALGIAGVALAVDVMLVVGIALLLLRAREYVDFSIARLFVAPSLALGAGMLLARATLLLPGVLGSDWRTAGVKTITFTLVYGGIVAAAEFRYVQKLLANLRPLLVQGRKKALGEPVPLRDAYDEKTA